VSDFIVEGEKRYWLHPPSPYPFGQGYRATKGFGVAGIALGRDGGTVLGTQLEEVVE
jgi:hypothetical protein